jgi:Xaa-Pro aminopeptidase
MSQTSGEKVAGARRAQRGAHDGMAAAIRILASASARDDSLWVEQEPLTSEHVRAAIRAAFAATEVCAEEITVTHGAQSAYPDSLGEGVIATRTPVVLDLYPRDRRSAVYGDLARTIAVDPPGELKRVHAVCLEVLRELTPLLRAGASTRALYAAASEIFVSAGIVAQSDSRPGSAWFSSLLGHGIGVQPHEPPLLAESSSDLLQEGDVVAVEPAVYQAELGGCRIENLYLIGPDGCEALGESPLELDVGEAAKAIGSAAR